ncbi:hypothetical protein Tsubulata_008734 [Turnera subulata]|uniref:Rhodanese domain-containing protein n=1 Tax=Turnera subulata TaxID=218843 RepID=A0A9Q0G6A4_9ROSI|nr:hypothetical protein Tsubulata_008734 [Turnera subulata]
MESLSMILSASPPIQFQNHTRTLKSTTPKPTTSTRTHFPSAKTSSLQNHLSLLKPPLPFSISTLHLLASPLPSLAAESLATPAEQFQDKINIESILVSIDDFLIRNPFFVAGCTFIWLVVIPLTESYFKKYKLIPAIDAFRKLRDSPDAQLLDIRDEQSVADLRSPNLKILDKSVVQVEYSKEDEDVFVKKVKDKFPDPANTVLCIIDSLDDNTLAVAELLFKNGFKEAYGVRGGVKAKKGWLAIQETLLPPSVHIKPKKKKKKKMKAKTSNLEVNGAAPQQNSDTNGIASVVDLSGEEIQEVDKGHTNIPAISTANGSTIGCRSPYPNYPDLKPPSSPTPSQPR